MVNKLQPTVTTMLDECGTIGPYFAGLDDPTYWVASGAYWAYFWARAAASTSARVGVVGQSQYMDSPDREPGVTMMCVCMCVCVRVDVSVCGCCSLHDDCVCLLHIRSLVACMFGGKLNIY